MICLDGQYDKTKSKQHNCSTQCLVFAAQVQAVAVYHQDVVHARPSERESARLLTRLLTRQRWAGPCLEMPKGVDREDEPPYTHGRYRSSCTVASGQRQEERDHNRHGANMSAVRPKISFAGQRRHNSFQCFALLVGPCVANVLVCGRQ